MAELKLASESAETERAQRRAIVEERCMVVVEVRLEIREAKIQRAVGSFRDLPNIASESPALYWVARGVKMCQSDV
jgi:hypothetical protein